LALVFWISAFVIAYVYVGYPALLAAGAFGRRRSPRSPRSAAAGQGELPLVSVIVAAHNEEAVIERKIQNILASDYPAERLEILIGSDGSSDRTEEIVRRYAHAGVGLVSFPHQQGKSAIQNGLVAFASGSILAFTDSDCEVDAQALSTIVERLDDSSVGLVTATPRYVNDAETTVTRNESAYLRYESWIREQESARGVLAVASGSLFAIRRDAWQPLDRNLGDDFELPLRTVLAGKRCVTDSRLHTLTRLSQSSAASMFGLKTRIVGKDFRALIAYRAALNPLRHGAVAIALWSHKLLRWQVPCFLGALFIASATLMRAPLYRGALLAQAAFYALAAAGAFLAARGSASVLTVPFSFCLVNAAALVGMWRCLTGRASGAWTPVRTSNDSAPISESAN
jgi:cellulose synthase/poly-beta-1,6-N-acetylglucosamine synthase-like glycosyltransferase